MTADRDWKIPKAEQEVDEWQTAMEASMLVSTLGDPTMFAHRHHESAEPSRRAQVQPRAKGHALGTSEAEEGPMKVLI